MSWLSDNHQWGINLVSSTNNEYQIIAYCCKHCAYAAADLAGGLRMQYSSAVKIVELPCTGRMDVGILLDTLEQGADGVMVAGWLPGDCHYLDGNELAKKRINYLQSILTSIGMNPNRVQMFNLSAAMASEFIEYVQVMTEDLKEIGLNPLKVNKQS